MARCGDRRPAVPGVLAVLAVLGVAAARVATPEVLVQLGHVTQEEAELLVIKTNSTASQVRPAVDRRDQNKLHSQPGEARCR